MQPRIESTEAVLVRDLQAFIGATILNVVVGDAGFPALAVRRVDGSIWWLDVQSDPEGNGPGFLNMERAS